MASTSKAQSLDLDRILDERIDWRYKSFPEKPATTIRDVRKRGWNLLDGEFMFPTMVLKESALRHDVDGASALPDAARRRRLGRHRCDDVAGPRLASFRCSQGDPRERAGGAG